MFNKVIMLGNITRDIELSYLPSVGVVAKTGFQRYKFIQGLK